MATQTKTVCLEKKHRKFIEFLRSRPESFNFSEFVRDSLERKMKELSWEYEEEIEDISKSENQKIEFID